MTTKETIARTIATRPDGSVRSYALFENGTMLFLRDCSDAEALDVAKRIDALIGPYGGEGGAPGDFSPMRLNAFHGWLVEFCWGPSVMTIVLPEDMKHQPLVSSTEAIQGIIDRDAFMAGIVGRAARNKDMRERRIVSRSWPVSDEK
jgi:hypothetical protein